MEFKAAVLHQVGAPMRIETVGIGSLRPGDVLVRIRASGLCHTDLEVIEGSLRYPLPIVLGHEGAGIVEVVGAGVTLVAPGDHVVCSWNPHCGHCFYCDREQPILCEPFVQNQPQGRMLDGGIRMTLDGAPLHHFSVVSSHAEYAVVPESGAVRVPASLPFDRACLLGCGVMTGVGATHNVAPVEMGSNVLVIGCGAVGLNAIQGAGLRRAGRIFAVDVDEEKLERARAFGATDTLDARHPDLAAEIRRLTQGRGADFVFECAGRDEAMRLSFEAARPGAEIVMLGKTDVNREVSFRFGSLMGERRFVRSSYGGARPHRDFPRYAEAYLVGALRLDELITHRLRLEQINDGFDAMRRGEAVRCVIEFDA